MYQYTSTLRDCEDVKLGSTVPIQIHTLRDLECTKERSQSTKNAKATRSSCLNDVLHTLIPFPIPVPSSVILLYFLSPLVSDWWNAWLCHGVSKRALFSSPKLKNIKKNKGISSY